MLRQNTERYQLPALTGQTYDIQAAFSRRLGCPERRFRLCDAVACCRLPDTFTFHTALTDAMYTALLTAWTPQELLSAVSLQRDDWLPPGSFAPQPKCHARHCGDAAVVLNNRNIRRQHCPVCGAAAWVTVWLSDGHGDRYYAPLCCERHGRFLCRLTVSVHDGLYYGCAALPPITPHKLQQFARTDNGPRHICKRRHK